MEYPKRLMGWVRNGNKVYELRFSHKPDLFHPNQYQLVSVKNLAMGLPPSIMFDEAKCPSAKVYYGHVSWADGYLLNKGDTVRVEEMVDKVYVVWSTTGGIKLRLKAIPDNIR